MATQTRSHTRLQLTQRLRRLRRTESIRSLVRETRLSADTLIYPMFVCEGRGVRREVGSNHRTLSTYLNALTRHGFALDSVAEPAPPPDWPVAAVPMFLVGRCRRR